MLSPIAVTTPPDREADQFEAIERLSGKVQLGVGKFFNVLRSFVAKNLHA
jgi:hypothetical protein